MSVAMNIETSLIVSAEVNRIIKDLESRKGCMIDCVNCRDVLEQLKQLKIIIDLAMMDTQEDIPAYGK